jgi:hypothetical protein
MKVRLADAAELKCEFLMVEGCIPNLVTSAVPQYVLDMKAARDKKLGDTSDCAFYLKPVAIYFHRLLSS